MPLSRQRAPVIYLICESLHSFSVLPSTVYSGGQPSDDGLHELAASRWHGLPITRQGCSLLHYILTLTTNEFVAVIFFYLHLPSPAASTFRSGAPCAARTFLPHSKMNTGDRAGTLLSRGKDNKNIIDKRPMTLSFYIFSTFK